MARIAAAPNEVTVAIEVARGGDADSEPSGVAGRSRDNEIRDQVEPRSTEVQIRPPVACDFRVAKRSDQ